MSGLLTCFAEAHSVHWSPAAARLTFQHRRVADGEIYLLTNWGPTFSGEASFPHSELAPEIWDTDTGAALPAGQYRTHDGRMEVSLKLAPHESTLVAFSRKKRLSHAVCCEGGRVAYEADGRLWARFDEPSPCVVELADGQRRELRADLPPAVALPGPWVLDVGPMQGVGLAKPVRLTLDQLVSWRTLAALRTYAGTATNHAQFERPSSMHAAGLGLVLELGELLELADVWLNGRRVATSWFAPLSVSRDLLGPDYTPTLGGDWFTRFTAALMLGAAVGGIALGNLGDVAGRSRELGISIEWHCRIVERRCAQNMSYRVLGGFCRIRHTQSGLG